MIDTTQVDVRGEQGLEQTASRLPVWQPAVDILEAPDQVVVLAEMPGVGPAQVEVTMENRVLTLRGTPAESQDQEGMLRREFGARLYERSFTVGDEIDAEAIQAVIRDGLLRVTLPKKPEHAPRRITVSAG